MVNGCKTELKINYISKDDAEPEGINRISKGKIIVGSDCETNLI